ncbi:MAG: ATP-dependent Clp protease adaptor ClpS, partial [Chloroflexi bacterium]|nr:ATP-dependent Clp protease adaptor ClpS [Chloroflexota bacterium]
RSRTTRTPASRPLAAATVRRDATPSAQQAPPPRTVATPTRERRTADRTDERLDGLYHLLLLDDDHHSYDYVVEMLGKVLGYAPEKAFALARIVDTEGRVIIETASHDHVTRHQRWIHSYGADPRIPTSLGSMSAVVEPATA